MTMDTEARAAMQSLVDALAPFKTLGWPDNMKPGGVADSDMVPSNFTRFSFNHGQARAIRDAYAAGTAALAATAPA